MNTPSVAAFSAEVLGEVARGAPIDDLVALLRRHRDAGWTRGAAVEALQALREGADASTEERLLDLLDLASGECPEHLSVWGRPPRSE